MSLCARAITRFRPTAGGVFWARLLGQFLAVIIGVCGLAGTAGAQSGPQLTMDSVNVRQEGVVGFSTLALGTEVRTDFAPPRFLVGQTEDQSFRLYVDVDSIQQLRFNAFTFTAYLANAKDAKAAASKFQVTGNPTGSFRDAPVRVSFHVKNGGSTVAGDILMPVYNAAKTDLLAAEKRVDPVYVSVSGATPFDVAVANGADTLPVAVTDVAVTPSCLKCWSRVSSPVSDKAAVTIEPGTTTNLPLTILPNSIPALLQGALIIKSDVPHDTFAITVTYHTVPGGADRKAKILATLRFGPGLLGIALALFGGVALGLAARYLLTGRLGNENERALHAILGAVVFALIAEFIGILMVSYGNSKLIVFGLDIDPRQLFPAFILAMLVSGGSAVVAWSKGLFGKTA